VPVNAVPAAGMAEKLAEEHAKAVIVADDVSVETSDFSHEKNSKMAHNAALINKDLIFIFIYLNYFDTLKV
jgi:fructose-specific phosphotransferase system component IIB